ncbi:MAG: T9SS type A sorting domain-containing protein [Bacteroidetes bacterium]|nr:T9SS type A sorting domain-containing protein [Bacteroidota bacterium]
MNVNGQIVFHTTIVATQYELNVQNYPTGIYFIRLNSEASNKVYSFVKN